MTFGNKIFPFNGKSPEQFLIPALPPFLTCASYARAIFPIVLLGRFMANIRQIQRRDYFVAI